MYDEVHALEYSLDPIYLGYKSATAIDVLTDFYLAEMSALGWTEMPETDSRTPEETVLIFVGQRLHSNTPEELAVKLELALVDGQTQVTLREVDPSEFSAAD